MIYYAVAGRYALFTLENNKSHRFHWRCSYETHISATQHKTQTLHGLSRQICFCFWQSNFEKPSSQGQITPCSLAKKLASPFRPNKDCDSVGSLTNYSASDSEKIGLWCGYCFLKGRKAQGLVSRFQSTSPTPVAGLVADASCVRLHATYCHTQWTGFGFVPPSQKEAWHPRHRMCIEKSSLS